MLNTGLAPGVVWHLFPQCSQRSHYSQPCKAFPVSFSTPLPLNLGCREVQGTPQDKPEISVSIKLTFPRYKLWAAGDQQPSGVSRDRITFRIMSPIDKRKHKILSSSYSTKVSNSDTFWWMVWAEQIAFITWENILDVYFYYSKTSTDNKLVGHGDYMVRVIEKNFLFGKLEGSRHVLQHKKE